VRRAARPIARAGFVLLALASILAAPGSPAAQPDSRIPWIGYLANEPTPDSAPVLREVLRERGWIDGESIKVWYRYVQGKPELYQQHADELVRLQVRVIVAVGAPAIEAARRATKTVPIVMVSLDDPGATDTNLTGITTFAPELGPRRLELLRQIVPRLTRAAVLLSAGNASATAELSATKSAAAARGVELTPVEIADESDVREALTRVGKSRPQGLLVLAMRSPWRIARGSRPSPAGASCRRCSRSATSPTPAASSPTAPTGPTSSGRPQISSTAF
jgi:putative ABC transport system substrate-binding protein